MLAHLKTYCFCHQYISSFRPGERWEQKFCVMRPKNPLPPLIVFFADERKLTTLSQSASAPSCQDNHHSQCNPIMWTMFECYCKILPWHCRNISFCHCHKQQRVLKNQKTKKDIFTFSVAPSQLPSINRGLLECIRRSSVVVAGCYWKQKEKLV